MKEEDQMQTLDMCVWSISEKVKSRVQKLDREGKIEIQASEGRAGLEAKGNV